mgnify:FL=1|tara:strand:+ start:3045 stop:3389 length:345 start_codon:yes stop_codon:yes gene_type:complete
MADNPLPKPYFPVPPNQYDPAYFREMVKMFSVFLQQASNPSKITVDGLNLKPFGANGVQSFANNASAISGGLLPGDVYAGNFGDLRVVISPDVIVANTGVEGIMSVGNATVSTP